MERCIIDCGPEVVDTVREAPTYPTLDDELFAHLLDELDDGLFTHPVHGLGDGAITNSEMPVATFCSQLLGGSPENLL
jgi:hypothetical protein